MWFFGKRRKKRDENRDRSDDLLHDLKILTRIEEEIARFYELCAEKLPADQDVWRSMAADERQHAAYLRKMQGLVRQNPSDFRLAGNLTTASIRLFEMAVRDLPKDDRQEVLRAAREIENSAVHSDYTANVETQNRWFKDMARQIARNTGDHRERLEQMFAAAEAGDDIEQQERARSA